MALPTDCCDAEKGWTDCYDSQERPTGLKGPINPARNETYALLWKLLREAATAFPDSYIHLGGDEVPFDCWQVLLPLDISS